MTLRLAVAAPRGIKASSLTASPLAMALCSPGAVFSVGLIAALLLGAPSAVAQLGESADGCAKRYGPAIQQVPSVIEGGDPTARTYRRKDLHVTVHFRNGRAWHITYSQAFLSEAEKDALLVENAGTAKWRRRQGDRIGNVMVWVTEDNSVVVSAFEVPELMMLEVMSRACADDLVRQREQRILAAQSASVSPSARPSAPK